MKYIDIHCHLDSPEFDTDRSEILARMQAQEMGAITIGADLESSKRAVEIARANENIWACIGVHPDHLVLPEKSSDAVSALGHKDKALETASLLFSADGIFEELAQNSKVVGIGECGLDYFARRSLGEGGLSEDEKIRQKDLFEKQILLAGKYKKPLMLHVRASSRKSQDAYDDTISILEKYKKGSLPTLSGNVHFFAGNLETAKKFLDLDFTMSFTGVITFTHDYDEVIKFLPQNAIMAETDAPWVAPVPFRGERNEPSYVLEVIKKLAEVRGESFEDLNKAMLANFRRIFLTAGS